MGSRFLYGVDARCESTTDKGEVGQCVTTGQHSDGIEYKHPAGAQVRIFFQLAKAQGVVRFQPLHQSIDMGGAHLMRSDEKACVGEITDDRKQQIFVWDPGRTHDHEFAPPFELLQPRKLRRSFSKLSHPIHPTIPCTDAMLHIVLPQNFTGSLIVGQKQIDRA